MLCTAAAARPWMYAAVRSSRGRFCFSSARRCLGKARQLAHYLIASTYIAQPCVLHVRKPHSGAVQGLSTARKAWHGTASFRTAGPLALHGAARCANVNFTLSEEAHETNRSASPSDEKGRTGVCSASEVHSAENEHRTLNSAISLKQFS